ncbi:MAG: ribonuclease P protein component, partial [Deltaproteobacteria bacterium]|nr:ribonuclease P protein component [Deltaproteobacteria bacterium]
QTRNFTLCILANGLDRARLGISIGVAAGGAVERNRIKRLVREFFRLNKGRDAIPHSSDIVISVKKRTDLAGYRDVEEELKAAFIALTDSGAKKKPRQETP